MFTYVLVQRKKVHLYCINSGKKKISEFHLELSQASMMLFFGENSYQLRGINYFFEKDLA